MSAYLVCMVKVDDPETYRKYTAHTPGLIRKYGGRFLVRGGAVEAVEGPPFGDRLVLLEFPSKEVVREFYNSPEYQEIIGFRHDSSDSIFLLADGIDPGTAAPDDRVEKSA
jgi:uncharacterized protein (DUF1330 family)